MSSDDEKLESELIAVFEKHKFSAGKILKAKKNRKLYEHLLKVTPSFDGCSVTTRLWALRFHEIELPTCVECGGLLKNQNLKFHEAKTFRDGFVRFCSRHCEGVNREVQAKLHKTNHERYGCDWTFQSENSKFKTRMTNLEKYGVEYPQQNFEIHRKADETRLIRYGDKNVLCTEDAVRRLKSTTSKRFYDENLLQNPHAVPLFSLEEYQRFMKNSEHQYLWRCLECNQRFESPLSESWFKQGCNRSYARCPYCYQVRTNKSSEEINFINALKKEIKLPFLENQRILKYVDDAGKTYSKEIDVFFEKEKVGIEFNGVFFHSLENNVELDAHLKKTKIAEVFGIRLIHICSCQWDSDPQFWLKLISSLINEDFDISKYYDLSEDNIEVDRSIFNKCIHIPGFKFEKESEPEFHEFKTSNQVFHVPDCGKLIYKKI